MIANARPTEYNYRGRGVWLSKRDGKQQPSNPASNNADTSDLPTGVKIFEPQPPSDFCLKFPDIEPANGTQHKDGTQMCSSTTIGLIPSVESMISTIITSPTSGEQLDASVNITITLSVSNLVSGFFNLANEQYYLAPQTLNSTTGNIEGHQHITIQEIVG
ncbi:hypothetical protein BDEG_25830 [Batrachochytrium dendrobatidis JEL423]|uniref:Uncharacterized protein n=1 Tax=Batrachochytrium dendrobatidis (strain JEL423) TaxID=403673 RepID=A0A177WQH8_BATDL|nr:hypothetical protein BDEG_25830 [Batrachochytrium dendrobatidis JEL423]